MLHRAPLAATSCPNCGQPAPRKFCPECGQAQGPLRVTTREILDEIFDELLQLDSKLVRTLVTLVFRPGHLACEYYAGRRQRYVRPFRLYVGASVLYFLVLAVLSALFPERHGGASHALERTGELSGSLVERAHHLFAGGPEFTHRLWEAYLAYGPKVQLLAIPLYAALLLVVYHDARRTYAEHFVFALHLHAFYFMLNLVAVVAGAAASHGRAPTLGFALFALNALYLFAALRTAYPAGRLRTLWRMAVLAVLNSFVELVMMTVLFALMVALP